MRKKKRKNEPTNTDYVNYISIEKGIRAIKKKETTEKHK